MQSKNLELIAALTSRVDDLERSRKDMVARLSELGPSLEKTAECEGNGDASVDADTEDAGCKNEKPTLSRDSTRIPPAPVHYILRPQADPRLDRSLFVRYDPAPERKTGAIVIVCPGGNYDESDIWGHEAQDVGQWLAEIGITGIVLQYRVVSQGHYWPAQFDDYSECARVVKEQAATWGCDAARIGVAGFSAGGHLAAYAAVKADLSIRPKLQLLVYPATDTLSPYDDEEVAPWRANEGYPPASTSPNLHVTAESPPAFLAGMPADALCPIKDNIDVYARSLKENKVPFDYVLSDAKEEHGCGLKDWWTVPCEHWFREHGWAATCDEGSLAAEEHQA